MSPELIAQLRANAGSAGPAQKTRMVNGQVQLINQPKQKGKGGILSSLISEAGGAGGAAGGAALGASLGSVVPGLGTAVGGIAGAIIGGFGGGASGRLVENKIRDNRWGVGDALKEGAFSGALSGVGQGFQLARAGKAITETKGLGNLGRNILAGGEKQAAGIAERQAAKDLGTKGISATGRLANIGGAFRSQPRGIIAGVDQGGGRALSAAEAKAQNAAIDEATKGLTGLTKTGQFTAIDKRISTLSKAYKLTPEAKAALTEDDILKLMQGIEGNVTANTSLRGNLTKSAQTTLNNIYDDFTKMTGKSRGDLVDYAAQVNKKAAAIVNKGQVGSKEVQIWEEVRNATKDFIDNSPSFADKSGVNKKLSTLLGARSSLTKAVTADVSTGMRSGLTMGRAISDVASPGLDVAGRGLQTVGKVTASPLGSNLIRQSPASLSRALGGATQTQDQPQQDQQSYGQDTLGMGTQDMQSSQPQQAPQSSYSLEQAMADIQQYPKDAAKIQAYYKFVQDAEKAQLPSKTAIKSQDAKAAGSQALNIVDQLEQSYNQAGGARGRIGGAISSLGGKAGLDSAVSVYNDNKMAFLSNVARSLGEKGVLTDADIERVSKAFPSFSSTSQEAAAKWSMIKTIISGGIQRAQSAYASPSDPSIQITQYGQ